MNTENDLRSTTSSFHAPTRPCKAVLWARLGVEIPRTTARVTPASTTAGWPAASHRSAPVADGVLVVLYAADLAATEAKVRSAGGRIVRETFSFSRRPPLHFADPEGNVLAVWSE